MPVSSDRWLGLQRNNNLLWLTHAGEVWTSWTRIPRSLSGRCHYGTPDTPATHALIESAATHEKLQVKYTDIIAARSDHSSFAAAGIEVAALFTGFHIDYHKASDIPAHINMTGLARVVDVAEAIIRAKAD